MKDWQKWHAPYDDASSALSRRLVIVQRHIGSWLDDRAGDVTIVSACAGEGRDVLGVLLGRSDASRARVTLIESDSRNASAARDAARAACLDHVVVLEADAGELSTYESAVPADLVVMVGVFGNISDDDVRKTVFALPRLCADDATVIWSRSRREPDLTPDLRGWLADTGFVEEAFHAPSDAQFSIGVHRFTGEPQPLGTGNLFRF